MGTKKRMIVLLVLLLLAIWACWRIMPYVPFIPQRVTLRSALYVRSPHVYRQSPIGYDPAEPPLAPDWVRLSIERENSRAFIESSAGERVRVTLGKPYWVRGCENQFRMEAYPLPEGLSLGSLTFRQPVLIVVCDMWAAGEKFRPARVVIREGPIPAGVIGDSSSSGGASTGSSITEKNPFFLGVQCHPGGVQCLVFAEALGELAGTVVDSETGEALPTARIVLSSGMGIQEFTDSFRLPVCVGMQVAFQIIMPGYMGQSGEIENFYGNKLSIRHFTVGDPGRGQGGTLDLPGAGQSVDYVFELFK